MLVLFVLQNDMQTKENRQSCKSDNILERATEDKQKLKEKDEKKTEEMRSKKQKDHSGNRNTEKKQTLLQQNNTKESKGLKSEETSVSEHISVKHPEPKTKTEKEHDGFKRTDAREILSSDSDVCLDWTDDDTASDLNIDSTETFHTASDSETVILKNFIVIDKVDDVTSDAERSEPTPYDHHSVAKTDDVPDEDSENETHIADGTVFERSGNSESELFLTVDHVSDCDVTVCPSPSSTDRQLCNQNPSNSSKDLMVNFGSSEPSVAPQKEPMLQTRLSDESTAADDRQSCSQNLGNSRNDVMLKFDSSEQSGAPQKEPMLQIPLSDVSTSADGQSCSQNHCSFRNGVLNFDRNEQRVCPQEESVQQTELSDEIVDSKTAVEQVVKSSETGLEKKLPKHVPGDRAKTMPSPLSPLQSDKKADTIEKADTANGSESVLDISKCFSDPEKIIESEKDNHTFQGCDLNNNESSETDVPIRSFTTHLVDPNKFSSDNEESAEHNPEQHPCNVLENVSAIDSKQSCKSTDRKAIKVKQHDEVHTDKIIDPVSLYSGLGCPMIVDESAEEEVGKALMNTKIETSSSIHEKEECDLVVIPKESSSFVTHVSETASDNSQNIADLQDTPSDFVNKDNRINMIDDKISPDDEIFPDKDSKLGLKIGGRDLDHEISESKIATSETDGLTVQEADNKADGGASFAGPLAEPHISSDPVMYRPLHQGTTPLGFSAPHYQQHTGQFYPVSPYFWPSYWNQNMWSYNSYWNTPMTPYNSPVQHTTPASFVNAQYAAGYGQHMPVYSSNHMTGHQYSTGFMNYVLGNTASPSSTSVPSWIMSYENMAPYMSNQNTNSFSVTSVHIQQTSVETGKEKIKKNRSRKNKSKIVEIKKLTKKEKEIGLDDILLPLESVQIKNKLPTLKQLCQLNIEKERMINTDACNKTKTKLSKCSTQSSADHEEDKQVFNDKVDAVQVGESVPAVEPPCAVGAMEKKDGKSLQHSDAAEQEVVIGTESLKSDGSQADVSCATLDKSDNYNKMSRLKSSKAEVGEQLWCFDKKADAQGNVNDIVKKMKTDSVIATKYSNNAEHGGTISGEKLVNHLSTETDWEDKHTCMPAINVNSEKDTDVLESGSDQIKQDIQQAEDDFNALDSLASSTHSNGSLAFLCSAYADDLDDQIEQKDEDIETLPNKPDVQDKEKASSEPDTARTENDFNFTIPVSEDGRKYSPKLSDCLQFSEIETKKSEILVNSKQNVLASDAYSGVNHVSGDLNNDTGTAKEKADPDSCKGDSILHTESEQVSVISSDIKREPVLRCKSESRESGEISSDTDQNKGNTDSTTNVCQIGKTEGQHSHVVPVKIESRTFKTKPEKSDGELSSDTSETGCSYASTITSETENLSSDFVQTDGAGTDSEEDKLDDRSSSNSGRSTYRQGSCVAAKHTELKRKLVDHKQERMKLLKRAISQDSLFKKTRPNKNTVKTNSENELSDSTDSSYQPVRKPVTVENKLRYTDNWLNNNFDKLDNQKNDRYKQKIMPIVNFETIHDEEEEWSLTGSNAKCSISPKISNSSSQTEDSPSVRPPLSSPSVVKTSTGCQANDLCSAIQECAASVPSAKSDEQSLFSAQCDKESLQIENDGQSESMKDFRSRKRSYSRRKAVLDRSSSCSSSNSSFQSQSEQLNETRHPKKTRRRFHSGYDSYSPTYSNTVCSGDDTVFRKEGLFLKNQSRWSRNQFNKKNRGRRQRHKSDNTGWASSTGDRSSDRDRDWSPGNPRPFQTSGRRRRHHSDNYQSRFHGDADRNTEDNFSENRMAMHMKTSFLKERGKRLYRSESDSSTSSCSSFGRRKHRQRQKWARHDETSDSYSNHASVRGSAEPNDTKLGKSKKLQRSYGTSLLQHQTFSNTDRTMLNEELARKRKELDAIYYQYTDDQAVCQGTNSEAGVIRREPALSTREKVVFLRNEVLNSISEGN